MLPAVPPWVWHGVQNLSNEVSMFVNMFDRPDADSPYLAMSDGVVFGARLGATSRS